MPLRLGVVLASTLAIGVPPVAAQALGPGLEQSGPAPSSGQFRVEPAAETVVDALPAGPLYWRVERFPVLAEAQRRAGRHALAAEAWGQAWLFTLGPRGGDAPGGRRVAEIGPVPVPAAAHYRLRINRAGGPPGSSTPVHTHPGSEAFYVLKGQLTQRGPHGLAQVKAGGAMNGHAPGMVMQLTSTGDDNLEQLVMFVVDADQPFSSPARFK